MIRIFLVHVAFLWKILIKTLHEISIAVNHINIIHFEFKEVFTTLKCIYKVERSSYLHSVRIFFLDVRHHSSLKYTFYFLYFKI